MEFQIFVIDKSFSFGHVSVVGSRFERRIEASLVEGVGLAVAYVLEDLHVVQEHGVEFCGADSGDVRTDGSVAS